MTFSGRYGRLPGSVLKELLREGDPQPAYRFVVFRDQAGAFRWRFVAPNARIVAVSGEGYRTADDCKAAIIVLCREARSGTPIEFERSAG